MYVCYMYFNKDQSINHKDLSTLNLVKKHENSMSLEKCLKIIYTSIRFLSLQGIAFRGHGAGSGNVDQLLQLRCEYNPKCAIG